MSDPTIERLITDVTSTLPPSSGSDLSGFLYDLHEALSDTPELDTPRTEVSDDPLHRLTVRADAAPNVGRLHDLAQALDRVWRIIRYRDLQVVAHQWAQSAMVLRFVTAIEPQVLCVSGSIVVAGPRYDALVTRHDQRFDPLPQHPT